MKQPEPKKEAEKKPETEKKPEVESKPVEPGSKWSESWEHEEKKESKDEEEVLFGGRKYGYDDERDGYRQYDDRELDKPGFFAREGLYEHDKEEEYEREYKKEEEYEREYKKEKPRRRKPRFVPGVSDPADPETIADPKCHVDFSPFYDQGLYKFACLGEKNHTPVAGTAERPKEIK